MLRKQRDGASKLGMGWISRFVNHKQAALPYKEGAISSGHRCGTYYNT